MQHRGIHSVTQVLVPQVLEGSRAPQYILGKSSTGGPDNDLLEPCSR